MTEETRIATDKEKWITTHAFASIITDIDVNILCPCSYDDPNKKYIYCQDEQTVTCPKCGKKYKVTSEVSVWEAVK